MTEHPAAGVANTSIRLELYVAGQAPNSEAAVAALRVVVVAFPDRTFELEIIDVLRDPERALRVGVLITPLLLKLLPLPERRVLGNLRDSRVLLDVLGLEGTLP